MIASLKTVLLSILGAVGVMLLIQMASFFPWYISLVTEAYQLSAEAASYNYIHKSLYDQTLSRLQSRPVFNRRPDKIRILVESDALGDPIFDDNTYDINDVYGTTNVPYVQRGDAVTVTVSAAYPLEIRLWGKLFNSGSSSDGVYYDSQGVTIKTDIPVSFSITTIGLHYYKDLDLDEWYVSTGI